MKELLSHIKSPFSFSYSQLEKFLECPKQYWYLYRSDAKPKKEIHVAALFGNAFHKMLQDFYTRVKNGELINHEDYLSDLVGYSFHEELEKAGSAVRYNKTRHKFTDDASYRTYQLEEQRRLYEIGKALIKIFIHKYYSEGIPQRFIPYLIEYKISEPLLDENEQNIYTGIGDTHITAIVDLVEYDKLTGKYRIIDHKTSANFDKNKIFHNHQMTLYAFKLSKKLNTEITSVSYQIFSTYEKTVEMLHGERTKKHIDRFLEDVNFIIPAIKSEYNYRRPGKHCDYCPLVEECY